MTRTPAPAVYGTDGVHAETQPRDPSFVMQGHHCHSCYELFYVQSGECRFLIDDRIHDLRAGDFMLIPPMVLHYTRYVFGPCVRTVILFRREDMAADVLRAMPRAERFFSETSVFHVPGKDRAAAEACIARLTEEDRTADAFAPLLRRSLLQQLMLVCARVCEFRPGTASGIQTTDEEILKAARFISENYMRPITTGDVARAVGFSPNYLSRKFRASAGIGLHEYIVFVRLHHASQELIATADSITAIALRCGFSDGNYFKDSFKKKYGVTPREYRRMG